MLFHRCSHSCAVSQLRDLHWLNFPSSLHLKLGIPTGAELMPTTIEQHMGKRLGLPSPLRVRHPPSTSTCSPTRKLNKSHCWRVFTVLNLQSLNPKTLPVGQWVGLEVPTLLSTKLALIVTSTTIQGPHSKSVSWHKRRYGQKGSYKWQKHSHHSGNPKDFKKSVLQIDEDQLYIPLWHITHEKMVAIYFTKDS